MDERRAREDRGGARASDRARQANGTLRKAVPIWVVRNGNGLDVRSWRGPDGGWYRATQIRPEGHISAAGVNKDVAFVDAEDVENEIDAAYRTKYGRYQSYVTPMVSEPARSTTLKLVPRDDESPS